MFGAAVVVLFALFAITVGIGSPSVPDDAVAVVEEMPDGQLEITREQFDQSIEQMAAQAQIGEVPEEGDPQYSEVAQAAFYDLLDIAWIRGEAAERGVEASERQVREELETVAQQEFQCNPDQPPLQCQELQQYLQETGYSREDVVERIEVGIMSQELESEITDDAPEATDSELRAFYEMFSSQFEVPESVDLRLIQNENRAPVVRAQRQLEEDSSEETWNQVASRFSEDQASSDAGGLRENVTEGTFEPAVQEAIDGAETGELVGPVETESGFYLLQVEERNPAGTQDFEEVREELQQQVSQQLVVSAQTDFIEDYSSKWTARTYCAEEFMTERCANFDGENALLSDEMREQQEEAEADQAPALATKLAWPKPPETMTLPISAVTPTGTQVICYLEEEDENLQIPPTGIAPPQRPHPPGPDDQISEQPEGAPESPTCGIPDPAAAMPPDGQQVPAG